MYEYEAHALARRSEVDRLFMFEIDNAGLCLGSSVRSTINARPVQWIVAPQCAPQRSLLFQWLTLGFDFSARNLESYQLCQARFMPFMDTPGKLQ